MSILFVGNLAFKTTAETLGHFFESVGEVIDVSIAAPENYSLGYGFVEMEDEETAQKAVSSLNGKELEGRRIKVEIAKYRNSVEDDGIEFEGLKGIVGVEPSLNRLVLKDPSEYKRGSYFLPPLTPLPKAELTSTVTKNRMFLQNLPFDLHEEELKLEFSDYKTKEFIIIRDCYGRSRGYGFIEFESEEERDRALVLKKGLLIKGRLITLEVGRERKKSSDH
jgi:RNA recognition motif-containing protein